MRKRRTTRKRRWKDDEEEEDDDDDDEDVLQMKTLAKEYVAVRTGASRHLGEGRVLSVVATYDNFPQKVLF